LAANVIGVSGWKNSGKTTLVTRLVSELRRQGYSVATVKHAHHDFDIDHEGTDSYRHRAAGASQVAIISARRWALMRELDDGNEPTLAEVLDRLAPTDIVVVEGYKRDPIPKIEVRRRDARSTEPLAPEDPNVIGVAADHPCDAGDRPLFGLDDIPGMVDLILAHFHLPAKRSGAN
jgi:molybdopterin-guanine dinucleotide biosynthesis protein B